MKILILSFYFPPDLSAGSFRANALVKALGRMAKGPIDIDVITTMPNRYGSISGDVASEERDGEIRIRRIKLPSHQSGMVDQSKAFISFARNTLAMTRGNKWDLVIATSSRLMTAALGARVAKRSKSPLFLDIRDLFADTMSDVFAGSTARFVLPAVRFLEKRTFRQASRINLVSAGFLPYAKIIAPEQDFRVFTNGIDEEFLQLDFSKPEQNNASLPLAIYAGNMGQGQGLDKILPSVARKIASKVRFRLLGGGGRRRNLEEALGSVADSNIELLDPVPREKLYAHYKEADILFLHLNDFPAFRKVLPSKIFEYAATGKPILAGVAGYAADFLKGEVDGAEVFAPNDAEGMQDALDKLLSGPLEFERSKFREKFARSSIMDEMAKDILELARG